MVDVIEQFARNAYGSNLVVPYAMADTTPTKRHNFASVTGPAPHLLFLSFLILWLLFLPVTAPELFSPNPQNCGRKGKG